MRSMYKFALAACLLLGVSVLAKDAGDSPFTGAWKVILPKAPYEVSLWIVKIDKKGKTLKVVTGLGPYAKATAGTVKITNKSLTFQMTKEKQVLADKRAIPEQVFTLSMQPPMKGGRILGCVRVGETIMPAWMESTELDSLDEKTALRQMDGAREMEEALKEPDLLERDKALAKLSADHAGKPVAFFAVQHRLLARVREKSEPANLKPLIAQYQKLSVPHGPEMQLGANLDLTRSLLGHPKGGPLAAETARSAVKLLSADHPLDMKVTVNMILATALARAEDKTGQPAVAKDLDKLAGEIIKNSTGEEATLQATGAMASIFLGSPSSPVAELGLDYARKAEKLITDKTPLTRKAQVYRLLSRGLVARGKAKEAEKVDATLEKLEKDLDAEFRKANIPFELSKFTGRKGKSDHVVLVELFTNAQAPPCVAADVSFTAASQVYPAKDVVFLQYHVLRERAMDALATAAGDSRIDFYKADVQDLIPALLVDGKVAPSAGGGRHRSKLVYDSLEELIDKALRSPREAQIKLDVKRTGDKIEVKATISELKKVGDNIRLRLALVEREVRHHGNSGQRLHPHVVRSFAGGVQGFKLEKSNSSHSATLDLAALKKAHNSYLDDLAKKNSFQWYDRPMELKNLAVVAWIQDEDSKKVYEAARAEVP